MCGAPSRRLGMKVCDCPDDLGRGGIVEMAAEYERSVHDELGQVDQQVAKRRFVEEGAKGRQTAGFRCDQNDASIGRVRCVDAVSLVDLGTLSRRETVTLVERVAHRLRLECWRRSNIDPRRRSKYDPGRDAAFFSSSCG